MLSLGICTITNLGDVLPQIFLGCCTNPTYFLIGLPAVLAWVLAASVLLWRVMAHPPFYYNYILYAFVFAFNYTTTISCSLLFCIQLWQLWPTRRFITTTSCALLILHIQLLQLWPTRCCATTISYTLLLLHMTGLQLILLVQSQKPPNLKVVIEW